MSNVDIHEFCCFEDFTCPKEITLSLAFINFKSEENVLRSYMQMCSYIISALFPFSAQSLKDMVIKELLKFQV